MKKITFVLLILLAGSMLFVGCKKDEGGAAYHIGVVTGTVS